LLVTLPNPHPGTPAHPSTPKVLQAKERAPIPNPSAILTLDSQFESNEELGAHQGDLFLLKL